MQGLPPAVLQPTGAKGSGPWGSEGAVEPCMHASCTSELLQKDPFSMVGCQGCQISFHSSFLAERSQCVQQDLAWRPVQAPCKGCRLSGLYSKVASNVEVTSRFIGRHHMDVQEGYISLLSHQLGMLYQFLGNTLHMPVQLVLRGQVRI